MPDRLDEEPLEVLAVLRDLHGVKRLPHQLLLGEQLQQDVALRSCGDESGGSSRERAHE
jgi:hypothetical protein